MYSTESGIASPRQSAPGPSDSASAESAKDTVANFPYLRILQRTTIFLGIVMLLGAIVIVVAIAVKLGELGGMAADTSNSGSSAWQSSVLLEEGERLVGTSVERGRLFLQIENAGTGAARVVLVESTSGRVLGVVELDR